MFKPSTSLVDLADLAVFRKTEQLKSTAVGQHRAVPPHKGMHPAGRLDHRKPRGTEHVIGIAAQQDLCAHLF